MVQKAVDVAKLSKLLNLISIKKKFKKLLLAGSVSGKNIVVDSSFLLLAIRNIMLSSLIKYFFIYLLPRYFAAILAITASVQNQNGRLHLLTWTKTIPCITLLDKGLSFGHIKQANARLTVEGVQTEIFRQNHLYR